MAQRSESGIFAASEIERQLEQILASDAFARAKRLSQLLRYVVEHSLADNGASIKEYTLGVDVFDRRTSFDPRVDTIVRVQARRLRSKLKEYYRGEGRSDPLEIAVPKGGYIPVFFERCNQIESLAVLPLKNVSGDPTEDYIADGLTGALIADLVRTSDLRVTPQASAMRFKGSLLPRAEIAQQLDVNAVVEG